MGFAEARGNRNRLPMAVGRQTELGDALLSPVTCTRCMQRATREGRRCYRRDVLSQGWSTGISGRTRAHELCCGWNIQPQILVLRTRRSHVSCLSARYRSVCGLIPSPGIVGLTQIAENAESDGLFSPNGAGSAELPGRAEVEILVAAGVVERTGRLQPLDGGRMKPPAGVVRELGVGEVDRVAWWHEMRSRDDS